LPNTEPAFERAYQLFPTIDIPDAVDDFGFIKKLTAYIDSVARQVT